MHKVLEPVELEGERQLESVMTVVKPDGNVSVAVMDKMEVLEPHTLDKVKCHADWPPQETVEKEVLDVLEKAGN
jgi:hypothetical protein